MNEPARTIHLWTDIYPGFDRENICFISRPASDRALPPVKRIKITLDFPSDEELWPEFYKNAVSVPIKKVEIDENLGDVE